MINLFIFNFSRPDVINKFHVTFLALIETVLLLFVWTVQVKTES